jgi:glycosyltransferase involved in cell wall biosynthesis
MILLFRKFENLDIVIFVWNSADFNNRAAQVISSRKNVFVLDYEARKSIHPAFPIQWSETLDLLNTSILISKKSRINNLPSRRIIFIGRLTFQKGIDTFLKLAGSNPSISFQIFGSGPYRRIVEKHSLRYNNIYFHGQVEDVFSSLHKEDIVIIPSRYFEGVSLVLLEALARGMTVVSSGVDNLAIVKDKSHIFPSYHNDFETLVQGMIKNVS